jgi:hypothetical protein
MVEGMVEDGGGAQNGGAREGELGWRQNGGARSTVGVEMWLCGEKEEGKKRLSPNYS